MAAPTAFSPPRIETPRLLLTWPSPDQVDGFYAAIVGTAMFDTLYWDGPASAGELHLFWAAQVKVDPSAAALPLGLAVIERRTGAMIGSVVWRPQDGDAELADIGYALAPAWHRQGLGTEAVGALVDHGFATRPAERCTALAFVGNEPSRRLLERLGFVCEGVLRRSHKKRGVWVDQYAMALIRPDWERRPPRS